MKLTEILALCDKATDGPWDVWGGVADISRGYSPEDERSIACCVTGEDDNGEDVQTAGDMENAEFIAMARTELPRLAAFAAEVLEFAHGYEHDIHEIAKRHEVKP